MIKSKTLPLWNALLIVASTTLTGLLVVYVALLTNCQGFALMEPQ
jgi:hypothetical protein